MQDKFPYFSKMYTDASKSAQGVGFAITQDNIIPMHKLSPETCIFSAESLAIYEEITLANIVTSNHILILCDSLSSLLALQHFLPSN
jgi:hypothetical protein